MKNNGAITEKEFKKISLCKEKRNEIAHEINEIMLNQTRFDFINLIKAMSKIHKKISIFWIKIDIGCHSEFDEIEISENDITAPANEIIDYIGSIIEDAEKNHQTLIGFYSEKAMIRVALRMLEKEFPTEEISSMTELPVSTIKNLEQCKKIME